MTAYRRFRFWLFGVEAPTPFPFWPEAIVLAVLVVYLALFGIAIPRHAHALRLLVHPVGFGVGWFSARTVMPRWLERRRRREITRRLHAIGLNSPYVDYDIDVTGRRTNFYLP